MKLNQNIIVYSILLIIIPGFECTIGKKNFFHSYK